MPKSTLNLADLDGTNGFRINGIFDEGLSGWSVSSAGDVNGDGIYDILIGAPNHEEIGESYVVFGTASQSTAQLDLSSLDGSNGFQISGVAAYDGIGISVSSAGDVNGDGIDDIVIGAAYTDVGAIANAGVSFVVFGTASQSTAQLDLSSLDGSNGFQINGVAAYDEIGASVASAGDVNGDGIDDIIIGAATADADGVEAAGESFIVFGSDTRSTAELDLALLDSTNGFKLRGIAAYDESGGSVSSAGDVNGDGIDDIIIGALGADPNENFFAGESYVVFGSDTQSSAVLDLLSLDGTNGFKINGVDPGDLSGSSVSSAGDVNGDGIDDIILGARRADQPNGNYAAGESYVVFGSEAWSTAELDLSSLDGTNGFQINGILEGDDSGFSVSSAGDVNGDGIDDIIIGAPGANQSYVVFGEKMNSSPSGTVAITGTAAEGETLTAVTDTLTDDDGFGELSYQWKADGEDIAGATSNTLTLGQSEVGTAITVAVSYTDDGGTDETVTSSATSAVTNVNDDPTGWVEIMGTAAEGETLTAVVDTLADEDGLGELSFQWLRDGTAIVGATSSSYSLNADDASAAISVRISYTDNGGTLESVVSDATSPVKGNLKFETTSFNFVNAETIESSYSAYSLIAAENGSFLTTRIIPDDAYQKYTLQFGLVTSENIASTYKQYTSSSIDGWSQGTKPEAVEVSNGQFAFVYVDDLGVKISSFDISSDTATPPVILADTLTEQVSIAKVDSETLVISWYSHEGIHLTTFDIETWSQVSTATIPGRNSYPDLTVLNNGNIGVVYQSFNEIGDDFSDIYYAEIESETLDLLGFHQVNVNTLGWQKYPKVETDSAGNLFFVWQSENEGLRSDDIVIRKFNVDVQNFGNEVTVNDHIKDVQDRPSIAISSSNKVAVTYGSDNYPNTGTYIQVFDEELNKLNSETFIVDNTPSNAASARVEAEVSINSDDTVFVLTAAVDNNSQPSDVLVWNGALQSLFNTLPSGTVQIAGETAETETLTAITDTLADEDGLGELSFQWLRDGNEINGAIASSYTLAQDDVGSQISLSVSYTDGQGTEESVSSAPTEIIEAAPVVDPAFDIALASTSGNVATFEVYATEAADSGDPGLDDVDFVLSHSLVDMTIDEASIDLADGFGLGVPNYDATTGELNVAAIAIPPVTDLTTPILTFNATILNDDTPFNIAINDVLVDDTPQASVTEEFDFTSVEVESTVVGRGGQALSDVRVSYDFVTPSGQEQSIELPMQAASKVSQAMERGSDMTVTADRSIDEKSADAITANDALQALRLAVGLDKSDGSAEWHDYIAADINKDGQVSANDALNILKLAVGLDDADPADWVFVDSNGDWSGINGKNTSYNEGVSLDNVVTDTSVDMTGILVGDVNGSYVV